MPHIVMINGSARAGNYTGQALAVIQDALEQHDNVTVTTLEPATLKLAVPGSVMDNRDAAGVREAVAEADGLVLGTPEYHGSFSALLKLVIENLGFPSAMRGKPVALVGVAAGRIGAVKSLEHLRSVCSHVGATVLPGPISIARVRDVFDAHGAIQDSEIERMLHALGDDLLEYVRRAVIITRCLEEEVRAGTGD